MPEPKRNARETSEEHQLRVPGRGSWNGDHGQEGGKGIIGARPPCPHGNPVSSDAQSLVVALEGIPVCGCGPEERADGEESSFARMRPAKTTGRGGGGSFPRGSFHLSLPARSLEPITGPFPTVSA